MPIILKPDSLDSMSKTIIWMGMIVGSIIGGYIPVIFGSSLFSYASLFGNSIGAIIGIIISYKLSKAMGY